MQGDFLVSHWAPPPLYPSQLLPRAPCPGPGEQGMTQKDQATLHCHRGGGTDGGVVKQHHLFFGSNKTETLCHSNKEEMKQQAIRQQCISQGARKML